MTDYIPTTGYVRDFYSKFQPSILLDKGPNRQERACAEFDRWLTQVRAEAVSEFAKQHGIGDLESRPLYDAQQRLADLESEVEHLRTVERRLEAQVINAEAEALREAAEAFSKELGSNAANPGPKYVVGWLHNRAAKLEGK